MKRFFYIDGNNFLFFWEATNSLMRKKKFEKAQRKFLQLLYRSKLIKKSSFYLFFDGSAEENSVRPGIGQIRIIFSEESTADDIIKEFLEYQYKKNLVKHSNQQIVVVSDDHEVQRAAKRYDFSYMNNMEFLHLILPTNSEGKMEEAEEKPKDELSEKEIKEWMDLFNQNNENRNK